MMSVSDQIALEKSRLSVHLLNMRISSANKMAAANVLQQLQDQQNNLERDLHQHDAMAAACAMEAKDQIEKLRVLGVSRADMTVAGDQGLLSQVDGTSCSDLLERIQHASAVAMPVDDLRLTQES